MIFELKSFISLSHRKSKANTNYNNILALGKCFMCINTCGFECSKPEHEIERKDKKKHRKMRVLI